MNRRNFFRRTALCLAAAPAALLAAKSVERAVVNPAWLEAEYDIVFIGSTDPFDQSRLAQLDGFTANEFMQQLVDNTHFHPIFVPTKTKPTL